MSAHPRGLCARLISFITCFRSEEKPQIAYLSILPVEILEKILSYLDYASISRLRAVNQKMNSICVGCLNRAFFKIKNDIANYISISYIKLNITSDDFSEILKMYGRKDESRKCNFQLILKEIYFASMCFFILTNLQEKICTFTFYRNNCREDDDFVFIYGNCIDWAIDQLRHLTHHRVTLNDKDALRAPLIATKHSANVISFYKKKNYYSRTSVADIFCLDYTETHRGLYYLKSDDDSRVKIMARQVKLLLREICTDF